LLNFRSNAQSIAWETNSFGNVVSFKLPSPSHDTSTFNKVFEGKLDSIFFSTRHFDTTFLEINNETNFRITLEGVISGRSSNPSFKGYSVIVVDTIIGNTSGLYAKYITSDSTQFFKEENCYVTIANNHFYWFFTYSQSPNNRKKDIDYFFASIQFNTQNIKERNYKLPKIYLQKDAL
jgi:hypothetical protein